MFFKLIGSDYGMKEKLVAVISEEELYKVGAKWLQ